MIPIKLHLHNFLCYRQVPPLEFGGIHLACLAGDNGTVGRESLPGHPQAKQPTERAEQLGVAWLGRGTQAVPRSHRAHDACDTGSH
jgi:hypothetical protein